MTAAAATDDAGVAEPAPVDAELVQIRRKGLPQQRKGFSTGTDRLRHAERHELEVIEAELATDGEYPQRLPATRGARPPSGTPCPRSRTSANRSESGALSISTRPGNGLSDAGPYSTV